MAYATPEDVANRLGRALDDSETLMVQTRLEDAERMLKRRIPDLDAQAAASADYEATVVQVESEMVLRLVRNPDGYSQESDGNYSYAIYQQVASGKLEVFDDEWAMLNAPSTGMFVIEPVLPGPWTEEGAINWDLGPPPWWREGFIT